MTTFERKIVTVGVLDRKGKNTERLTLSKSVIAVLAVAEQGIPGPTYVGLQIMQASASVEWILNHNLGRTPLIQAFSLGGLELTGEVLHTSVNQTRLRFSSVQTGYVQLV